METGIGKAVRIAGSQTALAACLGIKPQAVQKWVAAGRPPIGRCRSIEKLLQGAVTRAELRPDAFGDSEEGV